MVMKRKKKPTEKQAQKIIEGFDKLLEVMGRPSCPNPECVNYKKDVPEKIKKQGFILSKDEKKKVQRYKCIDCGEKFTDTREKPNFRDEPVKKSIPSELAQPPTFAQAARRLNLHPETFGHMTKEIAEANDQKHTVEYFHKPPAEWLIIEIDVEQNAGFTAKVLFYFFPDKPEIKKVEALRTDYPFYDREETLQSSLSLFSPNTKIKIYSNHEYKVLAKTDVIPNLNRWASLKEVPELKVQRWTRAKDIKHLQERMNLYMLAYNEYLQRKP